VKEQFDQIREQIFDIRKFLGPLDSKLENLDNQIARTRISFELRTSVLESKIADHSSLLARHSEQLREILGFVNMSRNQP
jgi:hypothetical protein